MWPYMGVGVRNKHASWKAMQKSLPRVRLAAEIQRQSNGHVKLPPTESDHWSAYSRQRPFSLIIWWPLGPDQTWNWELHNCFFPCSYWVHGNPVLSGTVAQGAGSLSILPYTIFLTWNVLMEVPFTLLGKYTGIHTFTKWGKWNSPPPMLPFWLESGTYMFDDWI